MWLTSDSHSNQKSKGFQFFSAKNKLNRNMDNNFLAYNIRKLYNADLQLFDPLKLLIILKSRIQNFWREGDKYLQNYFTCFNK